MTSGTTAQQPGEAAERVHEAALRRLAAYGSELRNGFTNHAPMVADALISLGHAHALEPWLNDYLPEALPRSAPDTPVSDKDWRASLGRPDRESGWQARMTSDIASLGWRDALDRWSKRLAPGFAAAAAHGVIRTAHAARALDRLDSPLRRDELSAGLALWASAWQPLPGDPLAVNGKLSAAEALAEIPLVAAHRRRNGGAITTALGVLGAEPGFAPALATLNRRRHADHLALDLATAFADLFLTQVHTPLHAIVYTHSVTGVAAAARLGRHVGERAATSLLAHAWQTGAALHACYSERGLPGRAESSSAMPELVVAAVAHGDEHVIKLAEACREFYDATRDARFPAAVARALNTIPPAPRSA